MYATSSWRINWATDITALGATGSPSLYVRVHNDGFLHTWAAWLKSRSIIQHRTSVTLTPSLIHRSPLTSWWRHQMETFSALLAICAGNSPVSGEFSAQRPVTRGFDVFFDLRLSKRLSKQSWVWWFETPSRPLWRQCYGIDAKPSDKRGTVGVARQVSQRV